MNMLMFVVMTSVTVVVTSTKVLCDNFFDQEEAHNSRNYNHIRMHLLRIMTVPLMSVSVVVSMSVIMTMPVAMVVSVSMRMTRPRAAQMWQCVKEHVTEEAATSEGYQVVDHGVAKGGT